VKAKRINGAQYHIDQAKKLLSCRVIDMFEYTAIIRIDTKITCYGDLTIYKVCDYFRFYYYPGRRLSIPDRDGGETVK